MTTTQVTATEEKGYTWILEDGTYTLTFDEDVVMLDDDIYVQVSNTVIFNVANDITVGYVYFGLDNSYNGTIYDLTISGDGTLTCASLESEDVAGKLSIESDVIVLENMEIVGDLTIDGNVTMYQYIEMYGDMTIDGDLTLNQGIEMTGDMTIDGDLTLNQGIEMTGDLTINGDLTAAQGVLLQGDLIVNGDLTAGLVYMIGDMTVNNGATVTLTGYSMEGIEVALMMMNTTTPTLTLGDEISILTPADGAFSTIYASDCYMGTITTDGEAPEVDYSNFATSIVIGKKPATTTPSTGSSSSSSSTTTADPEVTTSDDSSVTATVEVSGSYSDSTATSTVEDADMEAAIEAAVEAAEGESVSVEIPVTTRYSTTTVEAEFSVDALTALVEGDVDNLIVSSDIGSVAIPAEALAAISEQVDGSAIVITISAVNISEELTEEQKTITGDATVYSLTVTCDGVAISSFGDYEVTVHIPYILREGELAENIVVWYIADDGTITPMNSSYDEGTQIVSFTTSHFSVFAVMYDTNVFEDVDPNDYYYDAVLWAVANGITDGTNDDGTLFSPTMTCTRAQAVTFLWRAAGEPVVDFINPFTDVNADSYYYEAVLWAVSEGITQGTSETEFSPDATCSRSQIVTLLWRMADQPVVNYLMTFSDVVSESWYSEAVRWAVSETITQGTGDTTFSPDGDCTRAEIVTFLYRYMVD